MLVLYMIIFFFSITVIDVIFIPKINFIIKM